MSDSAETKVCPLCAETIKAVAKVCPYCRKSQRRWAVFTRYDLAAILAALGFVGGTFLVLVILGSERTFAPNRDRIEVLNYQFGIAADEYQTNTVISGTLSNSSPYCWNLVTLEAKFFDKSGKIIDAEDVSLNGVTILSHSQQSFRAAIYDRRKIPEYASCRFEVRSARDPRNRFFNQIFE